MGPKTADENLETVLLIDEDLAEGGDILKSLSDGLGFAKKPKGQVFQDAWT